MFQEKRYIFMDEKKLVELLNELNQEQISNLIDYAIELKKEELNIQ